MSSVAHSRVKTINKECLEQAAEELGITLQEKDNIVKAGPGVSFTFDQKGNADVRYWDDISSSSRTAKKVAQLSTFYTMRKRMLAKGLKLKNSTKEVLAAIGARQSLILEFEEAAAEEKVSVNI